MPWKETNAMKEKRSFIDAMLKQSKPFRELCREYGISEKTGYKWRKRFLEQGYAGLEEESRAPREHPNMIDGDMAAELFRLRNAHPSWGAKKLQALYQRIHPGVTTPSLSSINRILGKAAEEEAYPQGKRFLRLPPPEPDAPSQRTQRRLVYRLQGMVALRR